MILCSCSTGCCRAALQIVTSHRRQRVGDGGADSRVLTSPRSEGLQIIATINLKELSSNLYGICAGCHPLMLSPHLGASLLMGTPFCARFLTPEAERVSRATDDDSIPIACLEDFVVKTLEEQPYCLAARLRALFCDAALSAVDKHLANRRMQLMNAEIPTVGLKRSSAFLFKQDPKLAAAICALYKSNQRDPTVARKDVLVLPERKLQFDDVLKLLEPTGKTHQNPSKPTLQEALDARKAIIKKIEDILADINRCAESGATPKLYLRNQRLWSNCIYDLDRVTLKSINEAKKTTLSYSSSEDKTRFNRIIFVLTKVHELLMKNLTVTRRELFYQNVTRLRNQANLDVAVRDVCCLLESPPWSLGIVATAKGLVAGDLTIVCRDGSTVDCRTSGGTLIPQDITGIKDFRSSAKYILVVEKDAIFQKLLDEGALVRLGPVIIITGKGYPDVCTRLLLSRLCAELRLTALALVDGDPHGFEIFLTFKYGSLAQSHLSSSLACSSLVLLGATHSDVMTLAPPDARLKLTNLDRRKLASLLKRPYLESVIGSQIKQELTSMLASGIKAEIESLAPTAAALCDAYLPAKIIQAHYLG